MNRIKVVDSLRGFSLFGILLANLLIFQYGMHGAHYPYFYKLNAFNTALVEIVQTFIVGSFLPIFAILFGFGIVKMSESLNRRGYRIKRALFRRGIILLTIGIIHAQYFFQGDILYLYGSSLLLIFWMTKFRIRTYIISIIVCIALLMGIGMQLPKDTLNSIDNSMGASFLTEEQYNFLKEELKVMKTGTLEERSAFTSEFDDPFFDLDETQILIIIPLIIFSTLPLFIVGMIFAKNRFFETPNTKVKKIYIWLTPVFIIIKYLSLKNSSNEFLSSISIFSMDLLAVSYMCIFIKLYHQYHHKKIFKQFEAVGKLSLTNYILQSVFHSFIYYGSGLQRFGDSNFLLSLIIAITFFILQLYLSSLYIKHIKIGPLEYITRVITYWTFKPKKINRAIVEN
ncbi:DUF418 domain-containing protein [Macrococcus sp. DPC7161]|uniref:DUF418 domain-containing protein n=1 Tax=Macrococcus sp. DPC7161 TaxID=2507060 RepID=UPI00100B3975|nr:DUF418 domain-containing protein [Macrococcus sp. DPC7161]RXK18332.1 DUF418 domain-containing protein [Macrococcus sp. DPC7161]